jgi:Domain of Unknown Function (DUF1080).
MKRIKQLIVVMFSIFIFFDASGQQSEWEQLFNGKDLTGWNVICQPKDAEKKIWVVEDGAISCNTLNMKGHNHVWLVSEREFSNFELHLKFQAFTESPGNSGIQFRARFDTNLDGGWMNGPQVDIHPPKSMNWRTGLIYDETFEEKRWVFPSLPNWDMERKYEPKEHIFKYAEDGDGWNELILICNGMQVKTIVNGIVRTDWDATGVLDNEHHKKRNVGEKGHFALQLHNGDNLKIKYKDIQIKEFK